MGAAKLGPHANEDVAQHRAPLGAVALALALRVCARPVKLSAAQPRVCLGAYRLLRGRLHLDRPAGAAPAGGAAPERDLLGEQAHPVLGVLRERHELAGDDLQHPLDRHLGVSDLGADEHVRRRQAAPQRERPRRVDRLPVRVDLVGVVGYRLERGPRHQQRHAR